jgi:hypothetical protein
MLRLQQHHLDRSTRLVCLNIAKKREMIFVHRVTPLFARRRLLPDVAGTDHDLTVTHAHQDAPPGTAR